MHYAVIYGNGNVLAILTWCSYSTVVFWLKLSSSFCRCWCGRHSMRQMQITCSAVIRWNGHLWNKTLFTGLTIRQMWVISCIHLLHHGCQSLE